MFSSLSVAFHKFKTNWFLKSILEGSLRKLVMKTSIISNNMIFLLQISPKFDNMTKSEKS
jgi:hypothetical protein